MEDDSDNDESLDWLMRLNRGGILNVGVKIHNYKCAMEDEIKSFLGEKKDWCGHNKGTSC